MSRKEREQSYIFRKLAKGELTQIAAAKALGFSTRWIRIKLKRFKAKGDAGLVHKTRGRLSEKRWQEQQEAMAMQLLHDEFEGFGPTFAAEKLEELHNIKVSRETLRKSMMRHGIWFSRGRRSKYRQRRQRSKCLGLMVQLDGSPHDWFERRGPRCCLLVFIDDATSRLLWLEFSNSESRRSVMLSTRHYIEKHGIPASFYVDYGGAFSVNNNNAERERLSQFERACKELGTRVIHASSPQAKGRVERSNKTLQDRLVKEMRLRGISTIEAANEFAQSDFLDMHNKMFAVQAQEPQNAHKSAAVHKLDDIFCIKDNRVVHNDFTIIYQKRILQLTSHQHAVVRPKEIVEIHEHFDGKLSIWLRNIELHFEEVNARPVKAPEYRPISTYKHPASHPWRVFSPYSNTKKIPKMEVILG